MAKYTIIATLAYYGVCETPSWYYFHYFEPFPVISWDVINIAIHTPHQTVHTCAHDNNQGFIQDFFVGGGDLFWNSKIAYFFRGGLGACPQTPPQKSLTYHCPEIESGLFFLHHNNSAGGDPGAPSA